MKLFSSVVLLLCSLSALAQIEGYVYYLEGEETKALPGASVYWADNSIGTITDSEGYYKIEKSPTNAVLVASFIGYTKQEKVIISRQGKTNFILKPDETSLQEVTVTGESKATSIDVSKASLNFTITKNELRKAPCCNLSESFETNASVDVFFSDAITGSKQIEMLGLAGKYAIIQRENIPYARGINASSGLNFIPGPFIESIQLTKGLSSVLNGYESITGQINTEFYKPESGPKLLLNVFANQGGRSELNILKTSEWNETMDNITMIHASAVSIAQNQNGDDFADIPTSYHLNLTSRNQFEKGNGWEGQLGINAVLNQNKGGQMDFINDVGSSDSLWGFSAEDRRFELFGKNGYLFQKDINRSIGFIYSISYQEKDAQFGKQNYEGTQSNAYLNVIMQDIIGNTQHTYKTGLSVLAENVSEYLDSTSESLVYQNVREEIVPGAFLEYTFEPSPKFTFLAGMRADYNSYFNTMFFTPRFNVRYALTENTTLRTGGGRGQRTPNIIVENFNVLASSRGLNLVQNIEAEVAWNAVFSIDQFIRLKERPIHIIADFAYTYFENKLITDLDQQSTAAYLFYNGGSSSMSVMTQIDYEWFKNFESRLAYKYLNSQDNFLSGLDLSYRIPIHRAFLNLGYSTKSKWKFDATLNWFGEQRLPNTTMSPEAFQQNEFSPDYFTLNAQVNKELKNWDLFIGVNNLLNFKQETPIVNSENPYDSYFDSNFNWGPIFGRMFHAGAQLNID